MVSYQYNFQLTTGSGIVAFICTQSSGNNKQLPENSTAVTLKRQTSIDYIYLSTTNFILNNYYIFKSYLFIELRQGKKKGRKKGRLGKREKGEDEMK